MKKMHKKIKTYLVISVSAKFYLQCLLIVFIILVDDKTFQT